MRCNSAMNRAMVVGLLVAVAGAWVATAGAQDRDVKKQSDEVWVLPLEADFDFGAENGNAIITRALPVNSLIIRKDWRLINLAIISIADAPGGRPGSPGNPEPVPGPKTFGLGDLTDALIYTRSTKGGLMWGLGAAFGIPIASDDSLGSGKWQAGPAVRLGYHDDEWRFGLLATNRWSFAGDSSRAEVNQLMMRGLIRRKLGSDWFFVSSPMITSNWNADPGQKWLVPLGGGFGRALSKGVEPVNVSLQAYLNVIKPEGAPDWVVRLGVTFPFQVPR